jgi:predicted RNA-binding Zn-ribbon protein involved in translation (DUF1610 family)
MKRRMLNVLTALSLVLCVTASVLWARSCWVESLVGHTTMRPVGAEWYWRMWYVRSANGYAHVLVEGHRVKSPDFADAWVQRPGEWELSSKPLGAGGPPVTFPANLWFELWHARRRTGFQPLALWSDFDSVRVPLWPVVLISAVLPVLRLVRFVRSRRRRPGLCPACGYNLAGNVSGVCPECGTAAGAVARARER